LPSCQCSLRVLTGWHRTMATCMMCQFAHTTDTHPALLESKREQQPFFLLQSNSGLKQAREKKQAWLWRSWVRYLNKMFKYYKNSTDSMQERWYPDRRVWSQDSGHSGVKTQDTAFETRNLDERRIVFVCWNWIGHVVHLIGLSPGSPKRWLAIFLLNNNKK
jgi:hypothetical protein